MLSLLRFIANQLAPLTLLGAILAYLYPPLFMIFAESVLGMKLVLWMFAITMFALGLVLETEEALGRPLISKLDLQALVSGPELKAYEARSFLGNSGLWKYLRTNYDLDEQIAFIFAQADATRRGDERGTYTFAQLPNELWKEPLSTARQDALVDAVTLDHEGIVLGLSGFFAARGLEIAELNTRRYNAPHTGAAMFSVQMTVNVPAEVHTGGLREEFMEYCDSENLDAVFEPAQR